MLQVKQNHIVAMNLTSESGTSVQLKCINTFLQDFKVCCPHACNIAPSPYIDIWSVHFMHFINVHFQSTGNCDSFAEEGNS